MQQAGEIILKGCSMNKRNFNYKLAIKKRFFKVATSYVLCTIIIIIRVQRNGLSLYELKLNSVTENKSE